MAEITNANDLIRRIAGGDEAAMKALYEAYAPSITHFVRGWLRDPSHASDIVHETMLVVWRKASNFEFRSNAKTWIFAIAKNKALENNRSGSRLDVREEVIPEDAANEDSPHDALGLLQDAEQVRDCIAKLSDAHRRAIHLSFYEDLSYAEIAEIEACPLGTVKTRIMHAKKLLLNCLSRKRGD